MTELKFDSEQVTYCPMNGTATAQECIGCIYRKVNNYVDVCTYQDVFPELKDFAGLEDCIYIRGTE